MEINLVGVSAGLLKDVIEMCLQHIVSPLLRKGLDSSRWLQRRKQMSVGNSRAQTVGQQQW